MCFSLLEATPEDWLPIRLVLYFFPLWTLSPRDHVTYCQARGLSGHTSPYGECVCSHLEATLGDWLPARLVYYFLTLAPCDYITYCQARGLSGHTSPRGECVRFFLEDYMPIEKD